MVALLLACAPTVIPTPTQPTLSVEEGACLPGQAVDLVIPNPVGLTVELRYAFGDYEPTSYLRTQDTLTLSCGELGENSPTLGPVIGYRVGWITAPPAPSPAP